MNPDWMSEDPAHVNDMNETQLAIMIRAVKYMDTELLDAYLEWASGERFFYGSTNESLVAYWLDIMHKRGL